MILQLQLLSAFLFCLGILLVIFRKNILIMLMGVELMLNAANLSLVAFSKLYPENFAAQSAVLLIVAIAAAESALGLAILIHLYRNFGGILTTKTTTLHD
ncbi:MAG: NADH-quinone oxidoreductase subunit NuoK [Oligoflexia bacterium]|nr:NADH-quinone oxidoreductase subunit NuoK [Oligoflexia bacterium]MBF0364098.1 NADH-quinone oxidoreductase subunit NuoK [Oligoflexia bacterium]